MTLVNRDEFKEMLDLGFIKQGDYATTMRQHSKARRHKHYVVDYKYENYRKFKDEKKN